MNAHRPTDNPLSVAASSQALDEGRDLAAFLAAQDAATVVAARWLVRRQDGLGPEEQAELDAWLAADPVHGEALQDLEGTWGRMDEIPPDRVDSLKAALARPSVSPRTSAVCHANKPTGFLGIGRFVPQLATAALVLAVLGGGWMGWQEWQAQPVYQQHLATNRGMQQQFTLPDGSTILLDTATRADVVLYRNRRTVRLDEGQAHFSVSPDSRRPFHVHAGTTEVTVVGTRFTVRRTPSGVLDHGVGVAVEEGRVRVAQAHAAVRGEEGDVLVLGAGESATVDAAGRVALADRSVDMTEAWRLGRVSFAGATLAQAVAEFERYGDTRVVIDDPVVARLRVHGSFELRRLDAFLKALPEVLPVRLRRSGGKVEIIRAG
ncbi:FecR family protein [Denitromonas iodatirespirans]|uniref:FecR domain-containing protein n=1 Tax=Denitromonas iodatirespirans TaxID=2795389 RepID=A0A944H6S0_DENI1|nr:FecR domain-containing protein [Denitromonas iodatirespirans]MBT0960459.1 FecR domain-containing protein [Denitromonas iodatirespirans]